MASYAFLQIGEIKEAEKIALEVLSTLKMQLTTELAEELGNILLLLGKDTESKLAFDIAIDKFIP